MDLKLTKEKAVVYDKSKAAGGIFKTAKRLEYLGNKQSDYNILVADNVHDLKRRICLLENENESLLKRVAALAGESVQLAEMCAKFMREITALKTETDRLKLTSKLNTNAIARMNSNKEKSGGDV